MIRESVPGDIDFLSGRLRKQDAEEVIALGLSEKSALVESFENSVVALTMEHEGVQVAMLGLRPVDTYLGKEACVWFLGSDGLSKIKKTFVKLTGPMLGDFLSRYPLLSNFVDFRYKSTIRWMLHFGAVFTGPYSIGPAGHSFVKFTITREALWARRQLARQ